MISQRPSVYTDPVDDLFARALVFSPVVIGYALGFLWTNFWHRKGVGCLTQSARLLRSFKAHASALKNWKPADLKRREPQ